MQACGCQIIQALRVMNLVDRLGYLQFDEDDVFDEQVNSIFPDHDPIVPNDHGMLLRDGELRFGARASMHFHRLSQGIRFPAHGAP
jgi:hypothetical protein